MVFDLIVRGGRVIDPSQDLDASVELGIIGPRVAAIGTVLVKVAGEIAGKNKEDPDPDGDVEHAVVALVAGASDGWFHSSIAEVRKCGIAGLKITRTTS